LKDVTRQKSIKSATELGDPDIRESPELSESMKPHLVQSLSMKAASRKRETTVLWGVESGEDVYRVEGSEEIKATPGFQSCMWGSPAF
jgi:hypothetical protein